MDSDSAGAETAAGSPVHRIEFDVDWPPGSVAAYLVDGPEPTLVDAGMSPDGAGEEALLAGLAAADLAPADVEHVLLTHPHVDHLGVVALLQEAGDPTVYAPATSRETFVRPFEDLRTEMAPAVRAAGVPTAMVETAMTRALDSYRRVRDSLAVEWVDEWVAAGTTFDVGGHAVTAVATPGHQQDHLCYRTTVDAPGGPEAALFSGDMGIATFRAPVLQAPFLPAQREGMAAYHEANDRLAAMDVDRVYPGHGPVHEDLPGAVALARESLERLCDRTDALLRDADRPSHALAIAQERTDDVTDGTWIPETVAALAHLEREGRAESTVEDGVRLYVPV